MARILWLDNDRTFLWPRVVRLEAAGHEVLRAYTITEANKLLEDEKDLDLIILDAMLNVQDSEEAEYPPSETDGGHKAGLVFYTRKRLLLQSRKIRVAAFTIREDAEIRELFKAAGLPESHFRTKMSAADTADFLVWIDMILKEKS